MVMVLNANNTIDVVKIRKNNQDTETEPGILGGANSHWRLTLKIFRSKCKKEMELKGFRIVRFDIILHQNC